MVNNIKKHGGTKFNIIVTVIGVVLSVVLAMILLWVYISISQICIACFVMMFALAGVYMEYRGESELRIITFACSWTLGIEDLLWLSIEDLLHSPLPIVLAVMNIWVVITSIYMYRKLTIEMIKNEIFYGRNMSAPHLFTLQLTLTQPCDKIYNSIHEKH